MIAYPGRAFGQLYHRMVKGNALAQGSMDFGDRTIELADISAPVLVFGGATDGIAPIPAVRAVVPLLTGSPDVRFEIVPGGHLGMLTGRAARTSTWLVMDEWIEQWSTTPEKASEPATPTPTPMSDVMRGSTAGSSARNTMMSTSMATITPTISPPPMSPSIDAAIVEE